MNATRRSWLKQSAALAALPATELLAVTEPYQRKGSGLQVGLAAYSFRNHFRYMRGKEKKGFEEGGQEMTMPGFIEFCAEHGAMGAELTSYFFPPEFDAAYVAECRRVAHVNGVEISGTAVGNNFSYPKGAPERAEQMAYVKEWIDHAVAMGAPHIRVFAGKHPKGVSEEDAEKNAIEALEEAGDYAGQKGIFLGIENHDSIGTADRLLRIVTAVKSPYVGVNLDSGNFRSDDPYAEMAASAPYAVNVQLKTELDVGKERQAADQERIIGILREAGYAGWVILEYEEDKDPYEHVPPLLEKLRSLCDV
jgi:sugar phosphate isomerase/epimerase